MAETKAIYLEWLTEWGKAFYEKLEVKLVKRSEYNTLVERVEALEEANQSTE